MIPRPTDHLYTLSARLHARAARQPRAFRGVLPRRDAPASTWTSRALSAVYRAIGAQLARSVPEERRCSRD